jgi:hypothetical protein
VSGEVANGWHVGHPNHSVLQQVAVFVANGDSDPMTLPRYSYLLAGLLH